MPEATHLLIVRPEAEHHSMTLQSPGILFRALIGGTQVAASSDVLVVRERYKERASEPVLYFPREDVAPGVLVASEKHKTTCPLKGQNTHYDLIVDGERHLEAAWSYQQVHDYDANLKRLIGRVAFTRRLTEFEGLS